MAKRAPIDPRAWFGAAAAVAALLGALERNTAATREQTDYLRDRDERRFELLEERRSKIDKKRKQELDILEDLKDHLVDDSGGGEEDG